MHLEVGSCNLSSTPHLAYRQLSSQGGRFVRALSLVIGPDVFTVFVHDLRGFKVYRANFCGADIICVSEPDLVQEIFEGDPHRLGRDWPKMPSLICDGIF